MTAAFEVNELAFQNGDVLAALDESPHGLIATTAELARMLGRDKSNLSKTLAKLTDAGVLADPPLSGLTPEGEAQLAAWRRARDPNAAGGEPTALLVELIPDPDQPRKAFEPEDLAALADSIADKGLLQPILVRPAGPNGLHMIVAGERRYRALGQLARDGLWPGDKPVPIRIATPEDEAEAMELALVENTQRTDLNHMELALGYQRLADLGRTPKQIAAVVGRTNDHVTQHLRLTRLDADDQAAVAAGTLPLHQALEKLREPKPAEAPPAQWTVNDVHRTPFGFADGDVEPLICLWQMTNDEALYRIDYAVSLGGTVQREQGNEALPNPGLAKTRAIAGLRHRFGDRLPRPAIEWLDRLQGPHVVDGVDYYNAGRAQEARYTLGWDQRRANSGGATAAPLDPMNLPSRTGAQAASDRVASDSALNPTPLSARARLALIELAHKVAVERRPLDPAADPAWTGDREADHVAFGASVGTFWLDGAHGELTARGLAAFAHVRGGLPPVASLTARGVAFLIDEAMELPVDDRSLERAQLASGLGVNLGVTYETPWLEQVAQPLVAGSEPGRVGSGGPEGPTSAAHHDDPWGRSPDQVAEDDRLDAQVAQLAIGGGDPAALFADFGVAAAETRAVSDDDIGVVYLLGADGGVVTTVTVDSNGELPHGRAQAFADLVAHQLAAVLG